MLNATAPKKIPAENEDRSARNLEVNLNFLKINGAITNGDATTSDESKANKKEEL